MRKNGMKLNRHSAQPGRFLLTASVSLAIMGSFSVPAFAVSNDEIMKELRRLQQRVQKVESKLEITEQELTSTKQELVKTKKELIDTQVTSKKPNIRFSKTTGMPKLVSDDRSSSLEFNGRVQLDVAALPDQHKNGRNRDSNFFSSRTESEIRRARLGIEGVFHSDWEYELELDFAENEVDLKKAQLTYGGIKDNDITVGFQRVAFGLENTASSRYTTFMERGLTDTFSPDRNLGVAWRYTGWDWGQFKVGAYIPNTIDSTSEDDIDAGETTHRSDAYNYVGRFTVVPINLSNQVLHLGVSAAYTNFSNVDSGDAIRYRARPESHLSQRLVTTGKFYDPDNSKTYGLEAAYSGYGFLLQSEYVGVSTKGYYDDDKLRNEDTYKYDSWYVSAAYMLTGETHAYRRKGGTFGNVMPDHPLSKGGWGAWEIAGRFSSIDLNDNGEKGGQLDDFTFGVNWYMENNLKLMFNYIRYDADSYEEYPKYEDQDDNILQTRLQWFF
ncbi:porin [sulfur-oxidizing endosymbiont of Gigantopelta aegis]|uniref:porin n=1 Tax=sulfur-oxidizing endosymbiont of Gigantopelta aegis TaxID=2794934 RepID=UPI0018DB14DC|nr:porin [sulfur-oxidizing endosymbiont of Gigantopelta aegis]